MTIFDNSQSDDIVSDKSQPMARLREIMRRLRDPENGCPWDIAQDFSTIAPYTIEEAYEVADAIDRRQWDDLRGELGDLLFQSVFHAQLAEEKGLFTFDDVANGMSDKMINRHPHVFGGESRDKTPEQQSVDWEKIKATERANVDQSGALDGVAVGLPSLLRAYKLQKRAARVGFDWPEIESVIDKIAEESLEVVEARQKLTQEQVVEEVGDLLFVIANLSRHLDVDPEQALRQANSKFERRFKGMEALASGQDVAFSSLELHEMEGLWEQVKRAEKGLARKLIIPD